jgi:hypothetical protein
MSHEGLRRLILEARKERINQSVESVESEVTPLTTHTSLTSQPELKEFPGGQLRLMERLQSGQAWLATTNAKLDAEDAIDTPMNEKLAEGFDLFGHLEYMLRFVYEYYDCIHGPGQRCSDDEVVVCERCSG